VNKLLKFRLGTDGNPVRLWQVVRPSDAITEIVSGKWIDFVGRYPDYPVTHLQILELIAQEIGRHFSDRCDHRIRIADAASRTGACPDHLTHDGTPPISLDIQYFTRGPNNHTQSPGPITDIWTDGRLNDLFDAERNTLLVKLMFECFPGIKNGNRMLVHPDIKAACVAQAKVWWPSKPGFSAIGKSGGEWQDIDRALQPCIVPAYLHNTHMHSYVGTAINWDAII